MFVIIKYEDVSKSFRTGRLERELQMVQLCATRKSRDSSVGIALSYGMDDRGSRVRFPAGAGNFSLHHRVQNGCGAQPVSYLMGTRGSSLG
jgi:hypothetical protein